MLRRELEVFYYTFIIQKSLAIKKYSSADQQLQYLGPKIRTERHKLYIFLHTVSIILQFGNAWQYRVLYCLVHQHGLHFFLLNHSLRKI